VLVLSEPQGERSFRVRGRLRMLIQIKCVTSEVGSGRCDRCLKHSRECVYVEHQRGRKLGTR
jgi:hypothetical protein